MTNLRKLARGKECLIRLPGICCGNSETVVLAHHRMMGMSGMGLKSPDWLGAYACATCHTHVDTHHDAETRLAHLEGVVRTLAQLKRDGVKL